MGQVLLRISQIVKQSRQYTWPQGVVVGLRPIHRFWQIEHSRLGCGLYMCEIENWLKRVNDDVMFCSLYYSALSESSDC